MKIVKGSGDYNDYVVYPDGGGWWRYGRVGEYGPYRISSRYFTKWGATRALKSYLRKIFNDDLYSYYKLDKSSDS